MRKSGDFLSAFYAPNFFCHLSLPVARAHTLCIARTLCEHVSRKPDEWRNTVSRCGMHVPCRERVLLANSTGQATVR